MRNDNPVPMSHSPSSDLGAKRHTSIPVVIETSTFLERNANRDLAVTGKGALYKRGAIRVLPCELHALNDSWEYFRRMDLRKPSAVMRRASC